MCDFRAAFEQAAVTAVTGRCELKDYINGRCWESLSQRWQAWYGFSYYLIKRNLLYVWRDAILPSCQALPSSNKCSVVIPSKARNVGVGCAPETLVVEAENLDPSLCSG